MILLSNVVQSICFNVKLENIPHPLMVMKCIISAISLSVFISICNAYRAIETGEQWRSRFLSIFVFSCIRLCHVLVQLCMHRMTILNMQSRGVTVRADFLRFNTKTIHIEIPFYNLSKNNETTMHRIHFSLQFIRMFVSNLLPQLAIFKRICCER